MDDKAKLNAVVGGIATASMAFFAWVALSISSLQASDEENKRVNEMVYAINDTLIRVDQNTIYVKEAVNANKVNFGEFKKDSEDWRKKFTEEGRSWGSNVLKRINKLEDS